jgi:hypothetical protein
MEIPKNLHNPEIRFVLLGQWNKWKNSKTKEVVEVSPDKYLEYKSNKEWTACGKAPFESKWQERGYAYNDIKIKIHNNNIGVIGGYGRLRILDIDDPKLAEEFEKNINTYTVKTGSGGRHFYFFSDYNNNHVLINQLGELRADRYQVVSAPCIHPSGNKYTVIKDVPVAEISSEDLLALIKPYLRPEITTTKKVVTETGEYEEKDTSRSGKDMSEVCKLILKGATKEQVFKEMEYSAKWVSAPEQYKERTYEKAKQFVESKKETIPTKEEPKQFNELEIEQSKEVISFMYQEIITFMKKYLVMEESQYKIIALWILGTYAHEYFNTYPLLFFNAMRGSGKTRTLRLISALGNGGDGSVQNNLTEAVLFRIPRGKTTCIDEVEQIGNKEKATLRELLNAAYKKGMKVCRMKKTKMKNEFGVPEEKQVAEEFEPYFPIALANINGLDEVLADRAITLILEKSDNPNQTKKVEDFEKNLKIQWIKHSLCSFGVVVQLLQSKNIYEKWNFWLEIKHNYTNYTHYTNLTNNTNYTKNPIIKSYMDNCNSQKVEIDEDTDKFFELLDNAGIVGRNFELFSPLLILAKFIDQELFNDIFEVIKGMVAEKKGVEYESKDVSLYEFILSLENIINGDFISIKEITNQFRHFANEQENEDRWLNDKWMGKALKRLNLVLDKRRMRSGMEVRLNYGKAREKLKIFM